MKVAKLFPDAVYPTRKYPDDAGVDVYACGHYTIAPHHFAIVGTGVTFEFQKGYVMQVWPKGKNDHLVGAGIIEFTYQGELKIKVVNPYPYPMEINHGDAVAQVVLVKHITPKVECVELYEIHQKKTVRGDTGGIVTQSKGE
jgi:dUTP pyrophosphatase